MTVPCCPDAFQMLDGSDGFVGQNRRPWHIRTTTDQTLRPRKPDVDSAIPYSVATICDAVLYRVGVVPRDETLLTHQLVASPSIQIGGERVNIERCASRLSIERGQAMPFSTRYAVVSGSGATAFLSSLPRLSSSEVTALLVKGSGGYARRAHRCLAW